MEKEEQPSHKEASQTVLDPYQVNYSSFLCDQEAV